MKTVFIFSIMLGTWIAAYGQQLPFIQTGASALYYHGGFAGSFGENRAVMLHNFVERKSSSSYTWTNTLFSYDQFVPKISGGLGLVINSTKAGGDIYNYRVDFRGYDIALLYAPKLRVSHKMVLTPSVKFNIGNDKITVSDLAPGINLNNKIFRSVQPSFGLGLLLNSERYFLGANYDNVVFKQSDYKLLVDNDSIYINSPSPETTPICNILAGHMMKVRSRHELGFSNTLLLGVSDVGINYWQLMNLIRFNWIIAGVGITQLDKTSDRVPILHLGVGVNGLKLSYAMVPVQGKRAEDTNRHEISLKYSFKLNRLR